MVYFPQLEREKLYKTGAVVKRVLHENPHFISMKQKNQILAAVLKIKPNVPYESVFRKLRELREKGLFAVNDSGADSETAQEVYKSVFSKL